MDKENLLYLDLKDGRVVIQLFPEKAPNHVARIKELVRQNYYDGLFFHRVIEDFMESGVIVTSDGLIASWASWALFFVLYTFGDFGRKFSPKLSFIYPLTSERASSEILSESVLIYVMRPT